MPAVLEVKKWSFLTGHIYDLQRLWNHGGHLVRHARISGATNTPPR